MDVVKTSDIKKGLQTLYKSSVVMILATFLDGFAFVAIIIGVLLSGDKNTGANMAHTLGIIITMTYYVTTLLSLGLQVKAFLTAKNDEKTFIYTLVLATIAIVLAVFSLIFELTSIGDVLIGGINAVLKLLNEMVAILVCVGVVNVFDRGQDAKMVHAGYIVIIIYMLNMCVSKGMESLTTISIVEGSLEGFVFYSLRIISFILTILRLVGYSLFLRRARRTLD